MDAYELTWRQLRKWLAARLTAVKGECAGLGAVPAHPKNDFELAIQEVQREVARNDIFWMGSSAIERVIAQCDRKGAGRWREPVLPRVEAKSTPPQAKGEGENEDGENRPKDTTEVTDDSVGTTNQLHGGNGASGEVPSPQSTGGDASQGEKAHEGLTQPRDGKPEHGQSGRTSQDAPPSDHLDTLGVARREAKPADEDLQGGETGAPGLKAPCIDNPGCNAQEEAADAKFAIEPNTLDHHSGDEDASSLATSPGGDPGAADAAVLPIGHGGICLQQSHMERHYTELHPVAKSVVRAIRRLVDDLGAYGDVVPKWDGRKLITDISARSYRIARARQERAEPPVVVFLIDASGSCSSVAGPLLGAAIEAARLDERVCVIVHSNGYLDDCTAPVGAALKGLRYNVGDMVHTALIPLIQAGRIGRLIYAGDGDGFSSFIALSHFSKKPAIWADSFGAKVAGRAYLAPKSQMREFVEAGMHPNVVYWRGINSPGRMAWAIQESLKK
jgi:hypothetical protein